MKRLAVYLGLILLLFALHGTVFAATYYVSQTGSDSNAGTQASPWKTITKVNSKMSGFTSGDSIVFRRGDVWTLNSGGEAGALVIAANGSTGNSIIFGAYGSGNLPVFDGTNQIDSDYMSYGIVVITNASYITLDSVELRNGIKQNLAIGANSGNVNNIVIQNNSIHTNRTDGYMTVYVKNSGGQGSTHDISFINNAIYDSQWNAIRVTGGVANFNFVNNIVHDTAHNGFDTYPGNTNNKNFDIHGNTIYNIAKSASGAAIYLVGTSIALIYDNSLHDTTGTNDSYGIKVASETGFVDDNVTVRNNLIWNIANQNSNTYALWFNSCTNCKVLNNTLYNNYDTLLNLNNTNLTVQNNLAYKNANISGGMSNYAKDPLFVNPPTDLHLQTNSPACTAGTNGSFIGAYDCSGFGTLLTPTPTATPVPPTSTPTLTPTPTPTPTIKPGDANGDGHVDETDYGIWLSHFGQTVSGGRAVGDFDEDGKVDGVDYSIWLKNYGT